MKGNGKPASLKSVAESLGLSPTTVSLVLNNSKRAQSIPAHTRDRVLAAARALNYRPNYFARYLTSKRSFSVGVIVPEIGDGYTATILAAIERRMAAEGYFHIVASHAWSPELIEKTPWLLIERGVEGLILVNMPLQQRLPVPVVSIGERKQIKGVINMAIDNHRAAHLAIEHLVKLGHRRIAFFKGHPDSADTEDRWQGVLASAKRFGIEVNPRLTIQLQRESFPPAPPVPEEGYRYGRKLLARKTDFTALFAFNDIAAIGAISAFRDAGRRVPEDVSVIGFDDILASAFVSPPLTTIRQPLQKMGDVAAKTLLNRIQHPAREIKHMSLKPQLVVRGSTAICATNGNARASSTVEEVALSAAASSCTK